MNHIPSHTTMSEKAEALRVFDDLPDDYVLSEDEVGVFSGLSKGTRRRLREDAKFPPLVEFSPNIRRNTMGQLREWKASRIAAALNAQFKAKAAGLPQVRGRGRPRNEERA